MRRKTMPSMEEIRDRREIINEIDWEMTPEEAVTLYLEWGNNWTHGRFVKSKNDVSHYFVVNTWDDPPRAYLIRRNSDEALELASINLPDGIRERFLESVGHNRGVHAINGEIREWLEKELSSKGTRH